MTAPNAPDTLSRLQCNALRGIAILGIVLHNWTHWLPVAVKENEYTFTARNARRMGYVLTHPDGDLVLHLLSFFGHYGVPLFLFLSGYGLVMKYERQASPVAAGPFIGTHFLKLFRMMVIGFALFVVVDALTAPSWQYTLTQVVAQLALVNNLLPEPHHNIWPGPYWYFGLMLQLYVVYRLLLYRRSCWTLIGLVGVAWLVQALLPLAERDTLNWLRYNFVGSLLPFCLGVLAARRGVPWQGRAADGVALAVALAAIVMGSGNYQAWLWVPAAVVVAGISVVRLIPQRALQPLVWTGGISAALFVVHPAVRKVFLPSQHTHEAYVALALYLIVALVAAWLIKPVMKKN